MIIKSINEIAGAVMSHNMQLDEFTLDTVEFYLNDKFKGNKIYEFFTEPFGKFILFVVTAIAVHKILKLKSFSE